MKRRILSVRAGARGIKMAASLSLAEWAAFRAAARRDGRSVTGQIAWLIRRHLGEAAAREAGVVAERGMGYSIERAAVVRKAGEAREDTEMGAYWRSRPPEERVAEAERLRRLGVSLAAGAAWKPAIERTGRVVRRGA